MTNVQFYFAIGVPFFTILVVWIGTTVANRGALHDLRSEMRTGFEFVGQRFDRLESRIDRLETKLDRIDTEIRQNHEHRLTILEEHVLGRVS